MFYPSFDIAANMTIPGKEFIRARPEEVLHFLDKRNLTDKKIRQDALKIFLGPEGILQLEIRNGSISRHFMRESFLKKLLAWHNLSPPMFRKLSPDTIVMVLNDLLYSMHNEVIVTLEDNDALTLLSPAYTRTPDKEILETWVCENMESITRNDFFTRIYFKKVTAIEPAPEDIINCSHHFMNSETGFRSFEIFVFLFRLVCTNGAVHRVDLPGITLRHLHHGLDKDLFDRNLKKFNDAITPYYQNLEKQFQVLKTVPFDPDDQRMRDLLERTAGKPESDKLLSSLQRSGEPAGNLYDLYNYITSMAKTGSPQRELFLQQLAGNLFRKSLNMN